MRDDRRVRAVRGSVGNGKVGWKIMALSELVAVGRMGPLGMRGKGAR